MATLLKQSTSVTVKIGPFLDNGDGNTVEDGLTISQADVRLSKNGGNMAQKNEVTSCTHDELGWYDCPLDATDTNTLGILQLMVHESGALSVWHEFMVVPANVYDSLVAGSDTLQADVTQWLGTAAATPTVAGVPEVDVTHLGGVAQSLSDLKDFADDGYDPSTNKVQGVVLTDTTTAVTNGVTVSTNNDKTGYGLSAAAIQAIWDALTSALTTAGSIGKLLVDNINATISSRASQTSVDTIDDFLDTEVAAILEDTGTTIPAQISALNNLSAAQVNTEVDTALADINLDHLIKSAVDTNFATTVHLDSVIGQLADNGTTATFDRTTDSLEAIRDKAADIETDTQSIEGKVDTVDGNVDSILADTGTDGVVLAANAITDAKIASGAFTAAKFASGAFDAVWTVTTRSLTEISATLRNSIADNVLRRSLATAIASSDGDTLTGRSLIGAIARLVNRVAISSGTLTVYRTDDSTSLFTQTLTTDADAEPVVEANTD